MNQQDQLAVNAIRILGADAIDKAASGHPGMVLGAAPIGYALYAHNMLYDPADTAWMNRDRFVLSAGHGSMLQYALLHLFGIGGMGIDDLKAFRSWGSKTPGHPEHGLTPGVEASSGPLGQGIAVAVGMAMANAHLGAMYNRPGYDVVDHYTFALCGDGCMQEGVSSEASSLAGTLQLKKLIVVYDRNHKTIEGDISVTFNEDVGARYRAYGWDVIEGVDGDDAQAIADAIDKAKQADRPALVIVETKIGRYSALEDNELSHGAALGAENTKKLREALEWPLQEAFAVPQAVYDRCSELAQKGVEAHKAWESMMAGYQQAYPELYAQYLEGLKGGVPASIDEQALLGEAAKMETRGASNLVLKKLHPLLPTFFGGAADLASTSKTEVPAETYFAPDNAGGKLIHYGIREFAMGAIMNGLALHGGLRPYGAGFLVFSDYVRPAIRMGALMKLSQLYLLSHDCIGIGEDGATHQPVEQLAALRAMPGCHVFRPADYNETVAAYLSSLAFEGPTLVVINKFPAEPLSGSGLMAKRGAYVLSDSEGEAQVVLIGTGSEVHLCMQAQAALKSQCIAARVVSMPSMEVFLEQDAQYRESVLPKALRARVVVEAASKFGWAALVGEAGEMVCVDEFGASAPSAVMFEKFGYTVENVVQKAKQAMENAAH